MDKVLDVFELYADADKNNVDNFNKKLSSNMKVKIEKNKPKVEFLWIDKMEETIQYLDNILRAPTRLIINEEEVVKIEKIKKVTVESIKHLSKNAGFIDEVEENGDVKPGKLLNVFKEETFNTYENRFIYTLIDKMKITIKKEKDKLLKENNSPEKEFKRIEYNGNSCNGKNRVDIQLLLTASTETTGRPEEIKKQLERIANLEKEVVNLTLTATYQALKSENVSLITPPLKKNNVILKNVNFQYAAKLWDFLINEMDKVKKGETDTYAKEYTEKGKSKKLVDETFLLDYLILQCVENPVLNKKRKKEVLEQLIANIVEKSIDVNEEITEEQLKNLVAKQFTIVKYKRQLTNRQIQDIFKKYISKYVQKISSVK